jgi:hypothetical protein
LEHRHYGEGCFRALEEGVEGLDRVVDDNRDGLGQHVEKLGETVDWEDGVRKRLSEGD